MNCPMLVIIIGYDGDVVQRCRVVMYRSCFSQSIWNLAYRRKKEYPIAIEDTKKILTHYLKLGF